MVSVGDFCSVGTASDLLVVEAMWKQRGGVVRLCKLSNGLQLALPEERLTLSTDPVGAFRKHMDKIVRASRKKSRASAKPVFESNPACEFAEYLAITKDEGATYRIKSITYFLILLESQYLTPHYSLKALWRDVCVKCDLLDIDPPTLGFVRDRLHSRHRSLLLEMIGR